jgi:hypothetical protein
MASDFLVWYGLIGLVKDRDRPMFIIFLTVPFNILLNYYDFSHFTLADTKSFYKQVQV